jgi:hypothetical protein
VEDVTEVKHIVVNGERDTSDYVKKLKVPNSIGDGGGLFF